MPRSSSICKKRERGKSSLFFTVLQQSTLFRFRAHGGEGDIGHAVMLASLALMKMALKHSPDAAAVHDQIVDGIRIAHTIIASDVPIKILVQENVNIFAGG